MARTRSIDCDLDGRLSEQRECNLGVLVPVPLSERVEKLAELLYQEGHGSVSRKELVAALLHTAPDDPDALAAKIKAYRTATVRQAYVGELPEGNVVRFPRRAPGPRARPSGHTG